MFFYHQRLKSSYNPSPFPSLDVTTNAAETGVAPVTGVDAGVRAGLDPALGAHQERGEGPDSRAGHRPGAVDLLVGQGLLSVDWLVSRV